jgi:putative flavoprotein involved in K+ transport
VGERVDVLIIGGGQAGLAMGFYLMRTGLSFAVLDREARTGDAWRRRWDTLRLFTPRFLCSLPGLPAPGALDFHPTRGQVADYLEEYERHFGLPVRHDHEVQRLTAADGGFLASTAHGEFAATHVVVATGPFATPAVPAFAGALGDGVWQCHSSGYRAPRDVPRGRVLVVGGGNSGAQIAQDLCLSHDVTLVSSGPLIFAPRSILGADVFRYLDATGLLRADRDASFSGLAQEYADTIIGMGLRPLIKHGQIAHVPHRAVDASPGELMLDGGGRLAARAVVWCTGYRNHYRWMAVDGALDENGGPRQDRGVSPVPGLYWLGLPWQSRLNSALLNGVGADAKRLAVHMLQRHRHAVH